LLNIFKYYLCITYILLFENVEKEDNSRY
jgi:hypothetical protein